MINELQQINWQVLFVVLLPWITVFAAAAIIFLTAALAKDRPSGLTALLALAAVVSAFVITWRVWLANPASLPMNMLIFDRFGVFVWLLILAAAAMTILMSMPYLAANDFSRPEYYGLILLSTLGMGCLASAGNLLTVFLGIETMSLAVYVLTGFIRASFAGKEAALKYFLIGAFASAFLLMGVAFILGSSGTLDLQTISERAPEILAGDNRSFYLFGMSMLLIGFGFKIAAVPFHAWAPDVYEGAPTPITAFMAGAVKIAAFAAFLRVSTCVFRHGGDAFVHVMVTASIITMLVGNLAALVQENIKRMLAYSSIAHAGYLLLAFAVLVNDPQGAKRAVLFYLLVYVLMTMGSFAVITAVGGGKKEQINHFAGLSKKRPVLAAVFSVFLISLLGIPPTAGFFAKYYLFLAAVKSGFVWLVVIAVLNSVISAYYYLRPIVVMYFYSCEEQGPCEPLSPAIVAVVALSCLGIVYLGVFPSTILTIVGMSN